MASQHRKPTLPDTLPREGFIREALILRFIPISRTSWKNGVRSGHYPSPIKLGRCNLWRAQDIHAVIAAIEGEQLSDSSGRASRPPKPESAGGDGSTSQSEVSLPASRRRARLAKGASQMEAASQLPGRGAEAGEG